LPDDVSNVALRRSGLGLVKQALSWPAAQQWLADPPGGQGLRGRAD
jgi:hypothetical protein